MRKEGGLGLALFKELIGASKESANTAASPIRYITLVVVPF
jgi:hypothetical protein